MLEGSGITVFDRVDVRAVSVCMFIMAFCCIFTILLSVALLLEKGNHKLRLIIALVLSIVLLLGSVLFLLWFN